MASSGIVLILYIGFLCFIQNVLSHELNIKSLLRSDFYINRRYKNGAIYTEIFPHYGFDITKVSDGKEVLWQPISGEYSTGVTIINSTRLKEELLYIEIINGRRHEIKYYLKTGGFFLEVSQATFNGKLAIIAEFPSFDEEFVEQIRAEVEAEEKEDQKQQESVNLEGGQYETEDKAGSEGKDSDDILSHYQVFTEYLETPRRSTQDESKEESSTGEQSYTNDKKLLDITDPEKNKRVRFDYEINDGTPTLTVHVKSNRKVNAVCQDKNPIWNGGENAKLVDLTAYSDYGEFKLVQFCFSEKDDSYHKYFRKVIDKWEEIGVKQFEETMQEMKKKIIIIGNIALDIANPNVSHYLVTQEKNDKLTAYTYYPNTGYHLVQIEDGDNFIWSSDTKRCLVAIVVKDGQQIRLLKLEIFESEGKTSERFYKKKHDEYIRIYEDEYEFLLYNPDEEFQPPTFSRSDSDSGSSSSDSLDFGLGDYMFEDYQRGEEGDDVSYYQYQETQGQEYNYEFEKGDSSERIDLTKDDNTILQVLNPVGCEVTEEAYRGVMYRSYKPPERKTFDVIKLGDEVIWESIEGEYCDFVRMFYPDFQPRLGFLRLNHVNEEEAKDIYFIKHENTWAFVTPEYFMQLFDQYAFDP